MKNIIIPDQDKFDAKLKAIIAAGKDKLHVRMDFDGTVTKAIVDGKIVPSLTSVLRDEEVLGKNYSRLGHALYDKYRPIEIDPAVSDVEKKKAMHEWWSSHFKLIINSNYGKEHMRHVLESSRIQLRAGFADFAKMLAANNIPLVIMSSSGLGVDMISMILGKNQIPLGNIHIISNQFEWDNQGKAIKVKEPIVHTLNKNEETIRRLPDVHEKIKNRPNIFLLGNGTADITMADGAQVANLLSLGFLNIDVEKQLETFKRTFDVVILDDGPMDFPNQILVQIVTI